MKYVIALLVVMYYELTIHRSRLVRANAPVQASQNDVVHLVLDKTCMFTVFSEREGKPWSHSVKALQIIWNHFPQ